MKFNREAPQRNKIPPIHINHLKWTMWLLALEGRDGPATSFERFVESITIVNDILEENYVEDNQDFSLGVDIFMYASNSNVALNNSDSVFA
ncbi:hypothetical protein PIB30_053188 [Stylosanthes scabra]|uniref:Uncharacterized protein n=1 Tax=Stylosanthes scabra TaxID=79078 RepID=A0ABU6XJR3_9FABA|nr:hypothetical protein [Stylosanthes scabra]